MFSAVSSTGRANGDTARNLDSWRIGCRHFGVSAEMQAVWDVMFRAPFSLMRVNIAPNLCNEYIIPHFRAFVKLKYDFNRFARFFIKKLDLTVARGPVPRELSRIPGTAGDRPPPYARRVPPPIGQDRLILTRLRSGDRKLQRGNAGACPSRTHGVSRARRGTGPRPTVKRSLHRHRSARACPSRSLNHRNVSSGPLGPACL